MQFGVETTRMLYFAILFILSEHVSQALSSPKTLTRCEWGWSKTMTLQCQGSDVIEITHALYGRTSRVICPWSLHWGVTDCHSTTSLGIAKDICDGEHKCTLEASNDMFGDPCRRVAKYLKVTYQCKGEKGTGPTPPKPPQGVCGKPDIRGTRVVGGKDAVRGSWPWTVALKQNGVFTCGGTLIDSVWVATAAHCVFQGRQFPNEFSVVLGDHDLNTNEGSEQVIQVERIITHPLWNPDPTKINYDIAMLKLKRPARMGTYVKTACLPTREPPVGSKCYITGWGNTKRPGSPAILQQGLLPVVSRKQCDAKNRANIGVGITDAMLCGGDGGSSRLSGCHGDSGGPYVCHFDGRWELHGAVSHGAETCSSKESYTVFANIYYLKSWVERTMRG